MANSVAFSTLLADLRFLLDLASTSGRLTDAQGERLLNRSRDKLFGIISEAYGDDHFTYCVGVQIDPDFENGYNATIPLGKYSSLVGGKQYWQLANRSAWGNLPTPGSNDASSTYVFAPQFHRLRKVQMPENWTAIGTAQEYMPVVGWSGQVVDLDRSSLDRLNTSDGAEAWSLSNRPTYRLIGNDHMGFSLYFDPPPSATAAVLIWYVGNPIDLSGSSPSIIAPNWGEFLAYDAAVSFAIRDRDGGFNLGHLKDERDRLERAIREQARDVDDSSPLRIRNVRYAMPGDHELRDAVTKFLP